MVLAVIALLTGAATACMLIFLIGLATRRRTRILRRLAQWVAGQAERPGIDDELSKPLFERVIRPAVWQMAAWVTRFTPARFKEYTAGKLALAGHPRNLGPNEFLLLQGLAGIVFGLAGCGLARLAGLPLLRLLILGFTFACIGFLLPQLGLLQKIKRRQQAIQKGLPDMLDLLTVSVEAGLGFDSALAKVVEKLKGVLGEECARLLQEIRMGKSRREALREMADRNGVEDLTLFLTAMIQADQLGVSIGNVLRVQAAGMRQKRRQRAEEAAMKAPIKILLPLVFFIFPTLFIILLGPALIRIYQTFGVMK